MNGQLPNQKKQNKSQELQNRRMRSETSRKKISAAQSEISQRYEQLQKILFQQNGNLKEQNLFLLAKIRKISKREKSYKLQLQEINYRVSRQESYISKVEEDFSQLKHFIHQNIETLISLLKANHLERLKHTLSQFINNITQILCLKLKEESTREQAKDREKPKYSQVVNQSVELEIDQLKLRLETLLGQNKNSCKQPAVRRQCIDIARKIKHLKGKKITPHYSFAQAQDLFSQFQTENSKDHIRCPNSNRQKGFFQLCPEQSILQMYQIPENKERRQQQRVATNRQRGSITKNGSKWIRFKAPFFKQK